MTSDDNPVDSPGVIRLPRPPRDSHDTDWLDRNLPESDQPRGTQSRHQYADPDGNCTHPGIPDDHFCHRPAHQHPGLCHLRAGWGTGHTGVGQCRKHGGARPGQERQGAEILAQQRAAKALAQLNTAPTPIDNPLQALADLAGEAMRWKDVLAAHVADLSSLRYSGEDEDGHRTEQIRGEVVLYERALASLGRLLVAIGRLNIDDRLARIDERLTDIVVRAVDAGLRTAGVAPEDMDRVRGEVGAQLRRMSAA